MYSKQSQTQSLEKTHAMCSECERTRMIKFFDTPRSRKCNDCKRRAKRVKKRSSKSYTNAILDKQWSEAVKKRDNYKCLHCGKEEYLNSHHIFTRNNYAVRWDVENGATLCSGCHTMSSIFSAHKTPVEFVEFIKDLWGNDWYERLRTKARKVKK